MTDLEKAIRIAWDHKSANGYGRFPMSERILVARGVNDGRWSSNARDAAELLARSLATHYDEARTQERCRTRQSSQRGINPNPVRK